MEPCPNPQTQMTLCMKHGNVVMTLLCLGFTTPSIQPSNLALFLWMMLNKSRLNSEIDLLNKMTIASSSWRKPWEVCNKTMTLSMSTLLSLKSYGMNLSYMNLCLIVLVVSLMFYLIIIRELVLYNFLWVWMTLIMWLETKLCSLIYYLPSTRFSPWFNSRKCNISS